MALYRGWNLVNVMTEELLLWNLTIHEAEAKQEAAEQKGIHTIMVDDKDLELYGIYKEEIICE